MFIIYHIGYITAREYDVKFVLENGAVSLNTAGRNIAKNRAGE
jgi:hypothetical protein